MGRGMRVSFLGRKRVKVREKEGVWQWRLLSTKNAQSDPSSTEKTSRRWWERGERRHGRKRWQFIRVPGIVDMYYHAKYNMLTTWHNTAILSIPPGTADRRIASLSRALWRFYCRIRQMQ